MSDDPPNLNPRDRPSLRVQNGNSAGFTCRRTLFSALPTKKKISIESELKAVRNAENWELAPTAVKKKLVDKYGKVAPKLSQWLAINVPKYH